MHQKRIVKTLMLDVAPLASNMFVSFVDLRSLRETCALLMHRLRREKSRHLRREIFHTHWAVVLEQWVKSVVTDPCFIPEYVVA